MRKLEGNDVCCGFGGTFCVKYPAISNAIVEEKAAAIERTGADLLLAGDLGCLMNMAGKLSRRGSAVRCFHTIEVLAGMADGPAIGEEGMSAMPCSPVPSTSRRTRDAALADRTLKIAIDRTTGTAERKRAEAVADFPEFEAARRARAADQGPRDRQPRPLPRGVRAQRHRRRRQGPLGRDRRRGLPHRRRDLPGGGCAPGRPA